MLEVVVVEEYGFRMNLHVIGLGNLRLKVGLATE